MEKSLRFKKMLWTVMRLTLVQMILVAVFGSMAYANGSKAQDVLNKDVSLKVQSEAVRSILSLLEKQTNAKFVYSDSRIRVDKRVSLEAHDRKLAVVLNELLSPLSIGYTVTGNYIVLTKDKTNERVGSLGANLEAHIVRGTVKDAESQEPMVGVIVSLQGTSKGTVTDEKGDYTLALTDKEQQGTLVFSFVGYDSQTVPIGGKEIINTSLKKGKNLDEVVVTGVFDPRTRLEASTAISILKTKDIEEVAATSATDLLKNVPGVFVNAGRGEIANQLYLRGLANFPAFKGFYYISMQEDGLPVFNINDGVDYYLRADATTSRVEAVRGGSASILGANAPGGIFNYISKTGGETLGGEVLAKFGLEGDGQNPYYRVDFNIGGPLNADKSLRFNIGGFYRQSDGAHYIGYAFNNGGQIKANVTKTYKTGSLKVYAKILDDHNGFTELTPTQGWNSQSLPAGFSLTSAYDIPSVQMTIPVNGGSTAQTYDSRNKMYSHDYSLGLSWTQELGNGFTLKNDGKISSIGSLQNTSVQVSPYLPSTSLFYILPGLAGKFGLYTFTDMTTGQVLGTINRLPSGITPGANNNFPGAPNTLLFLPAYFSDRQSTQFMDQLSISKQLKDMNFTLGAYFSPLTQNVTGQNTGSGIGLGTVQDRPHLVDVTLAGTDGKTYQVTNPQGFMQVGGTGQNSEQAKQDMFALFFGHNWQITSRINLDWGLRYESVRNYGWNAVAIPNPLTNTAGYGGADGNPLTLYDNWGGTEGVHQSYDKTLSYLSFSGGLNYKIDDKQAVYVRYSDGNKSPDISFFYALNTPFIINNTPIYAQKITQFEVAYKLSTDRFKLFITPFYTHLSNVANAQYFTNTDGSTYTPPIQFAEYETEGVELEANVGITKSFSIKGGAVFQNSKALHYSVWVPNAPGPQDDALLSYTGNATPGIPKAVFNIAPTFTTDKFYASINYSYVGDRPANVANGWQMKGYSTVDLSANYAFSKRFALQVNVNNMLNDSGVLDWLSTGGFPNATNLAAVTPAFVAANPNSIFSTLRNMPRAYFMTATYKF